MKITYEHEMPTSYNSKHMINQESCTHSQDIKAQQLQHKTHNSGNKLLTKNKIQT